MTNRLRLLLLPIAVALASTCAQTPLYAQALRTSLTLCPKSLVEIGDVFTVKQSPTGTLCIEKKVPVAPPVIPPVTPPPNHGGALFVDGFESGAWDAKQNGVGWTGHPYVSIGTTFVHSGKYAAIVDQSAGWGELRFDGLPKLPEVWIQFWLYLPNGSESPTLGPKVEALGAQNDKFFRLWGNGDSDYGLVDGLGNKVGASTWGGKLQTEAVYSPTNVPADQWGITSTVSNVTWAGTPQVSFIDDAHRGRWMKVGIHAKNATSANNNGVVEIFVDGVRFTGYNTFASYPFGVGGRHSFTTGYLLGALNNGGRPNQKVYVDDVSISATGFPPQ